MMTSQEDRVTKQKNPNRVAAGRAGAAARKAKQERVLGELQDVKTSLKLSDDDDDVVQVAAPRRHYKSEPPKGSWYSWILPTGIGILAVVGIIYNMYGKTATPPAAPTTPHAQLKADPFYME